MTPVKRLLAASLLLGASSGLVLAGEVLVVGHRGTGSNAPGNPFVENTIPSVEQAFSEGADFVEVDVQLEAGDQVILWHDDDMAAAGLEGLATWDRFLDSYPTLRAPGGGEAKVPTLKDTLRRALELAKGPLAMDIEIKLSPGQERRWLVQEVARVLLELGVKDKVLVTSFDMDCIRLIERVLPGIRTGFLARKPTQGWELLQKVLADPREPRIEWILTSRDYRESRLSPAALAKEAKAKGIQAGVWTVNDRTTMEKFVEAGFEMLITDEPERAP
jgi:glycerophosphoryl diester phosphodiesterase